MAVAMPHLPPHLQPYLPGHSKISLVEKPGEMGKLFVWRGAQRSIRYIHLAVQALKLLPHCFSLLSLLRAANAIIHCL